MVGEIRNWDILRENIYRVRASAHGWNGSCR